MAYMFEHPINAWWVLKPWGGGGCMVSDLGLGAWNSWYRTWACIRSIRVREYFLPYQRGHYCLKTSWCSFSVLFNLIFLPLSIRLHRIWNIGMERGQYRQHVTVVPDEFLKYKICVPAIKKGNNWFFALLKVKMLRNYDSVKLNQRNFLRNYGLFSPLRVQFLRARGWKKTIYST
jgi:hypothetical protein